MIQREDYYKKFKKSPANSDDFFAVSSSSFPEEGIFIGDFVSSSGEVAPALIPIEQTNGICFLSRQENDHDIKSVMQMMSLRFLCSLPAGMCKMVLYDGEHAGAELIHLANLSSFIIGNGIIDNISDLQTKLEEVKKNISTTTQKVLGANYANKSLVDYNKDNPELAKPYTLVLLADFPHSFDKNTATTLQYIIKNGRKAGVFVIMNVDTNASISPTDYNSIDLQPYLDSMCILYESENRYYIKNLFIDKERSNFLNSFALHLVPTIPSNIEEIKNEIDSRLNQLSASKLDMSSAFSIDKLWQLSADNGISTPIGKINSSKFQNIELSVESGGKQSYHHCLIGGCTGSGKTVLLHNIICNTAWLYSPLEVQFILLDFKEGTEFNVYKGLPHIKVLSIQSDIDFAKNVFLFLQKEIERRGEIFKSNGVQNFHDYNVNNPSCKLPRFLVIVDEFQKMFEGYGPVPDAFKSLIADLGKRARSFGINLIFSTQGLGDLNCGNALDEFGLRIAMQLNSDAECGRILDRENRVPRTLTKKGESVYCPGGLPTNNSIYQVAYLSEEAIKERISFLADSFEETATQYKIERFIFSGESPTIFEENPAFASGYSISDGPLSIFIGTPFTLTLNHFSFDLKRENNNNVIIVGPHISAAVSIIYYSILQIIKRSSSSRIVIADKNYEDSAHFLTFSTLANDYPNVVCKKEDCEIQSILDSAIIELNNRKNKPDHYERMAIVFFNVYNYRPFRMIGYDITTETKNLRQLLVDGPMFGIHLFLYFESNDHIQSIFGPSFAIPAKKRIDVHSEYVASVHTEGTSKNADNKIKLYNI